MIDAASYFRMSDDSQDTSIASQQPAVKRLAQDGGYRIVAEYKDEGISGDATDKRKAFHRMHADALAGKFKAILCWDSDRFGRFDSIEAGYWIHPLRQAGIKLVTVTEGPINWDDFTGRVMYSLKQEGKHQYVRDLSKNVLRGMADKARTGQWVAGRTPIGYVIGPDGRLALGDPQAVALVQTIFDGYLSGHSLRSLVEHLNARGYRTAGGRPWEYIGLRFVLTNRNYTGDMHWNLRNDSKYSSLRGGKVEGKARATRMTSPADWIVIRDAHPAIIPRETFEAVQARLASNRHRSTPHPAGGGFVLSGLLRCAKCGSAMTGNTYSGHLYYVCCGYFHRGASFCLRNSVRQDELVDSVVAAVQSPATIKRLKVAVRKEIEELAKPPQHSDMKQQLAKVRGELKTAERNMALAGSDDLRVRYEGVVAELVGRERAMAAAADATPRTVKFGDSLIDDAVRQFQAVSKAADPVSVRGLLHEFVERIDVRTRVEERAKRKRFYLDGGHITLNLLGEARCAKQVIRFRAG